MLLHVSLFVALFISSLIFLGITTSKISISLFTKLPELQNQALDFLPQACIFLSQSSVIHPDFIILVSKALISPVQFSLRRIQLPYLLPQLFQISILPALLLELQILASLLQHSLFLLNLEHLFIFEFLNIRHLFLLLRLKQVLIKLELLL